MKKNALVLALCFLVISISAIATSHQYSNAQLESWKTANSGASCTAVSDETDTCEDESETRYSVLCNGNIYVVVHILGARRLYWMAAIGARDPLRDLPVGAPLKVRIDRKTMYLKGSNGKETKYEILEAHSNRQ